MGRWTLTIVFAVLFGGCAWISEAEEAARFDVDLDQVPRPADCDDKDPKLGKKTAWYPDNDGDGFGSPAGEVVECFAPPGFVEDGGDCNDDVDSIYPDADENCDGIDNDCDGEVDNDVTFFTVYADGDSDGFGDPDTTEEVCDDVVGFLREAGDCDDDDPAVNPDADEICNLIDDDCDGLVDLDDDSLDLDTARWYLDADGDGFGDLDTEDITCGPETGFVANSDDCDDTRDDINPDADEYCDNSANDEDCDGVFDEDDAVNAPEWFADTDGDGYGDALAGATACYRPVGRTDVTAARDCDDNDPGVHPSAAEVCDGIDNNCDVRIDDADPRRVDAPFWYLDADGDLFGDPAFGVQLCIAPAQYVVTFNDCDDGNIAVNPDAPEICDEIDNDCDELVDDADNDLDEALLTTFFLDGDGDGFGSPVQPFDACVAPPGYLEDNSDCNDFSVLTNPIAPEVCDGIDNDCDGLQDDGVEIPFWYPDIDGDGYGDGAPNQNCTPLSNHSAFDGDCDDNDAAINPGHDEICDNKDNDCDTLVDEDDPDVIADRWYLDSDGDNHGDASDELISCFQPPNYVPDDQDCDDNEPALNPSAPETCDGIDNDCDFLIDDQDPTLDATEWWPDVDGDGFGDGTKDSVIACLQPGGFAPDNLDCDDLDASLHPNGPEICDGIDNDCDALVDDADNSLDLVTAEQGFTDSDGDQFGDPASPQGAPTCLPGLGLVFDNTDCDDGEPTTYPGAPEFCDGEDHNCDGDYADPPETWSLDADGDGYGDASDQITQCSQPSGYVFPDDDCDDGDPSLNPGAPEVCDGDDNDCDTLVDDADDNVVGATWYADFDQDGFGTFRDTVIACDQPDFYDDDNLDCDDIQAVINPDAYEICDNIDNDCDGLKDDQDPDISDATFWYLDNDGDTFGDTNADNLSCDQPEFHVLDDSDCDDTNPAIFPGALEMCDTVDNDCDGDTDDADGDVQDQINWYVDNDGDGFGEGVVAQVVCFQPAGHSSVNSDCDDTDQLIFPGAPERCNGQDNDCDGFPETPSPENRDWYLDADGDGWGDPDTSIFTCDPQPGYVLVAGDCDDDPITGPDVHPGTPEICDDLIDNDCDGLLDGDDGFAVGGGTLYADTDGDGFGDPLVEVSTCSASGFVQDNTDCDDTDGNTFPGAPSDDQDVEDGYDRDCDGLDECLIDVDGDGFYGQTTQPDDGDDVCASPGEGTVFDDCNDSFVGGVLIFPGAAIAVIDVGDGVDRNCDGAEECFQDADFDGDGDDAAIVFDGDADLFCLTPGESLTALDCDDADPIIYDQSPEYCGDGIDNNCDGLDENTDPSPTPVTWWLDRDGDGFGGGIYSIVSCGQPDAFVLDDTDCDDENTAWAAVVYPGAPEVCDLHDNDCNNFVDNDDVGVVGGPCVELPAIDEAFTCLDVDDIGLFPELYGWQSTWIGDNWTSDTSDGVANQTISGLDLLSGGGDAENFLLTGHSSWNNTSIEATLAADSGAAGLVLHYSSTSSYYSCVMTDSASPGCMAAPVAGGRVVLSRVDGAVCSGDDDYMVDSDPFTYSAGLSYDMQLSLAGNTVTCAVDVDGNGLYGDPGDVSISFIDGDELPTGLTGVAAWNLVNGVFDDIEVTVTDGDVDKDGLPNITESALAIDFLSPDDDADTIADVHETLMADNPPDGDLDLEINPLDKDSDADGISDEVEAGDVDLFTPPVDTDCDGLPDYMDNDSDNDGVDDDADNCRIVSNNGQADGDGDGLGYDCDTDDGNPDVDNDYLNDGLEIAGGSDPLNPDTDGDGLLDGEEQALGTNKLFSDSDVDGLSDFDEVMTHLTDPLNGDTDGGGAKDGEEVDAGTNPVDDPLDD